MNKFKDFLSSKGFYVALCVGVFAFAILMVANDYRKAGEKQSKEQAIDLNQPAENVAQAEDTTEEITTEAEQIAASDDAQESEISSEETLETNSDGAQADVTNNDSVAEEPVAEVVVPEVVFNEEESLVWPLIGNVILPYSMDTTVYFQTLEVYKCNPGVLIEAAEGANVVAACNGVVKEVKETKEFGTMVVVDMGSGYEATYGQLMNVCVGTGEQITESQNIGEIAPVSSYYTEEGEHLYFSITKDGEPVDPMTLIQ